MEATKIRSRPKRRGTVSVAERVIGKCGGVKVVADMLGVDVASVYKWTYETSKGGTGGLVPAGRQQELLEKASARGCDLSPADFFEPQTSEIGMGAGAAA